MIFMLMLSIVSDISSADVNTAGLVRCLKELPFELTESEFPVRLKPDIFLSTTSDNEGTSIYILRSATSFRCKVPEPIVNCLRDNPNCKEFDFLMVLPNQKNGVQVSFVFDRKNQSPRLRSTSSQLSPGTVDLNGNILKVVPVSSNPVLGLKCVPDRSTTAVTQIERNLIKDIGRLRSNFDQKFEKADRSWRRGLPIVRALESCSTVRGLHESAESERTKFYQLTDAPSPSERLDKGFREITH